MTSTTFPPRARTSAFVRSKIVVFGVISALAAGALSGACKAEATTGPTDTGGLFNIPMGVLLSDPGEAQGIATNPTTGEVYIGVSGPMLGVNVVRDGVVSGFISVPDGASSLSYDQNSGLLFAAGYLTRHVISMIDPGTGAVSTYSIGPDNAPAEVAVDAVHQKVYIEGRGADQETVTVFDELTRTMGSPIVLSTIGTGGSGRPSSLTVDPYRQKVYALVAFPARSYGRVSVIDGATNSLDGTPIAVDPSAKNIALDPIAHHLEVASSAGVSTYDTTTRTQIGSPIAVGTGGALSVAADASSHRVVAGTADGQIAVITDSTGHPSASAIPIGGPRLAQPQRMAVNERTGRIYSANGDSFWMSQLSLAAPVITSAAVPRGRVGTDYVFTITASGLPRPRFAVTGTPLYPWLTLDPATGTLSGTPPAAGTYSVDLSAQNGVGSDAAAHFDLVIESSVRPCLPWLCF